MNLIFSKRKMVRCSPPLFQAPKTSYLTLLFPILLAPLFATFSFSTFPSLILVFLLSFTPFLFRSSKQTPNTALKEPPPPTENEASPDDTKLRSEEKEDEYKKERVERVEWSEGSISEEEGLIEIAIPSGHFVIDSAAGPVFLDDVKAFKDNLLMGDEDNLIEIDIYMGSIINSSKFDISY